MLLSVENKPSTHYTAEIINYVKTTDFYWFGLVSRILISIFIITLPVSLYNPLYKKLLVGSFIRVSFSILINNVYRVLFEKYLYPKHRDW